jgi:hypothetical protein
MNVVLDVRKQGVDKADQKSASLQNVRIVKHMHNIPLVVMLLSIESTPGVQLLLPVVVCVLVRSCASHYKGTIGFEVDLSRTSDVAAKMPWK